MRLTDPRFKWHSSASHDADSQPFRDRQRARMAAALASAAAAKAAADDVQREADLKVRAIKRKVRA